MQALVYITGILLIVGIIVMLIASTVIGGIITGLGVVSLIASLITYASLKERQR